MIGVSDAVRQATGVRGGDTIEVDVELDTAPRKVKVPDDLAAALDAVPVARATFDGLSFSNQRFWVDPINAAKTERPASAGSRRRSRPCAKADRAERLAVPLHPSPLGSLAPPPDHDRPGAGLVVTVPPPTRRGWAHPEARIDAFLSDREAWIQKHLDRRTRERAELAARGGLSDGAVIRYRGELHRLRVARPSPAAARPSPGS